MNQVANLTIVYDSKKISHYSRYCYLTIIQHYRFFLTHSGPSTSDLIPVVGRGVDAHTHAVLLNQINNILDFYKSATVNLTLALATMLLMKLILVLELDGQLIGEVTWIQMALTVIPLEFSPL